MKTPPFLVASSAVLSGLILASAPSQAQIYSDPPASAPTPVAEHRFSAVDTDGNGQISREELDRLDDERMVFVDIDTDTSSAISPTEWNRLDLRFLEADTDRDGFISPPELQALGDDTMTFAEIDADRNSTISRVEWDSYNLLVRQDAEGEEGE